MICNDERVGDDGRSVVHKDDMTKGGHPMITDDELAAEAARLDEAGRCPSCGGDPERCGCPLEEQPEEEAA
jgi:hypothetical protein